MAEFKELQKRAEEINIANGWTRGQDLAALFNQGTYSEQIVTEHQIAVLALVASEAFEAIDEVRAGHAADYTYYPLPDSDPLKAKGVPSELADVVIRAMSYAEVWGIDLEAAILEKMSYNETRAWRHGGKKL